MYQQDTDVEELKCTDCQRVFGIIRNGVFKINLEVASRAFIYNPFAEQLCPACGEGRLIPTPQR